MNTTIVRKNEHFLFFLYNNRYICCLFVVRSLVLDEIALKSTLTSFYQNKCFASEQKSEREREKENQFISYFVTKIFLIHWIELLRNWPKQYDMTELYSIEFFNVRWFVSFNKMLLSFTFNWLNTVYFIYNSFRIAAWSGNLIQNPYMIRISIFFFKSKETSNKNNEFRIRLNSQNRTEQNNKIKSKARVIRLLRMFNNKKKSLTMLFVMHGCRLQSS